MIRHLQLKGIKEALNLQALKPKRNLKTKKQLYSPSEKMSKSKKANMELLV